MLWKDDNQQTEQICFSLISHAGEVPNLSMLLWAMRASLENLDFYLSCIQFLFILA